MMNSNPHKTMIRLAAFAALLFSVPTAEATVRPPIRIRMPVDTKAAVTGQTYTGVFEVQVGAEGTLDHVELIGEGWTSLALAAPAGGTRTPPGVVRVPFRAIPQDAEQPVGLSVTWNGRKVTKHFRVGPAAMARSGKPRPAVRLETGVGQPLASEPDAGPERGGSGACGSGPYSLRVTGRIVYTRSDSQVVGVDAVWVQVMDENTVTDNCIWEGLTFADGSFDTGWVTTDDPDGPDVYVRWECDTGVVNVQDGYDVLEEDYSWSTAEADVVHEDFGGGELVFGTLTSGDGTLMPAMHIHNTIVRAHRFILTESGIDVPEVDV